MDKIITFVGDLHGDWRVLEKVLRKNKGEIIQVGDLGLGFGYCFRLNRRTGLWEKIENQDPKEFPKRFRFIRGNHDNPATCAQCPNYMGDFGLTHDGIFFISGAWSIDAKVRTVGVDWWENEELSYEALQNAIDLYEKIRPEIVVSHTAPDQIINLFMKPPKIEGKRTEKALAEMFKIHQPKYWLFGHWHRGFRRKILGTQFLGLNINETFRLKFSENRLKEKV